MYCFFYWIHYYEKPRARFFNAAPGFFDLVIADAINIPFAPRWNAFSTSFLVLIPAPHKIGILEILFTFSTVFVIT